MGNYFFLHDKQILFLFSHAIRKAPLRHKWKLKVQFDQSVSYKGQIEYTVLICSSWSDYMALLADIIRLLNGCFYIGPVTGPRAVLLA